jgi:hypothetical protein
VRCASEAKASCVVVRGVCCTGKPHITFVTMAGEKAKTIPNSIKFLFGGLSG